MDRLVLHKSKLMFILNMLFFLNIVYYFSVARGILREEIIASNVQLQEKKVKTEEAVVTKIAAMLLKVVF